MKLTSDISTLINESSGQDNPIENLKKELNPAPHGFNKASRKQDKSDFTAR